jgi:hypothetical protein
MKRILWIYASLVKRKWFFTLHVFERPSVNQYNNIDKALNCHNIQTLKSRGSHMSIHTFSSRDFTRDVSAAKRAAMDGPVFITDRGRPAFALLKIDDYYRMAGKAAPSLLEVMDGIPGGEGFDFDPPKLGIQIQAVNLD